MMKLLRRLLCLTFGHEFYVVQELTRFSRRVGCRC